MGNQPEGKDESETCWQYSFNFNGEWKPKISASRCVRRRKWIRTRISIEGYSPDDESVDETLPWACPRCTLVNNMDHEVCSVCDAPRRGTAKLSEGEGFPPPKYSSPPAPRSPAHGDDPTMTEGKSFRSKVPLLHNDDDNDKKRILERQRKVEEHWMLKKKRKDDDESKAPGVVQEAGNDRKLEEKTDSFIFQVERMVNKMINKMGVPGKFVCLGICLVICAWQLFWAAVAHTISSLFDEAHKHQRHNVGRFLTTVTPEYIAWITMLWIFPVVMATAVLLVLFAEIVYRLYDSPPGAIHQFPRWYFPSSNRELLNWISHETRAEVIFTIFVCSPPAFFAPSFYSNVAWIALLLAFLRWASADVFKATDSRILTSLFSCGTVVLFRFYSWRAFFTGIAVAFFCMRYTTDRYLMGFQAFRIYLRARAR